MPKNYLPVILNIKLVLSSSKRKEYFMIQDKKDNKCLNKDGSFSYCWKDTIWGLTDTKKNTFDLHYYDNNNDICFIPLKCIENDKIQLEPIELKIGSCNNKCNSTGYWYVESREDEVELDTSHVLRSPIDMQFTVNRIIDHTFLLSFLDLKRW
jgi:hypothetical protein